MWSPAWPRSPCLSESLRHSERDQATPGLEVGEGYLWYYKCSGEKISKTSWGARSSWIDWTERQNKNQKNLELLEQLGLGGSSGSSWFPCLISWARPCGHHPLFSVKCLKPNIFCCWHISYWINSVQHNVDLAMRPCISVKCPSI